MTLLQPPGCKMGMSFKDHRFTSSWKMDHSDLTALYHKTMTDTVVTLSDWKDALNKVIFDQLQGTIDSLGEVKILCKQQKQSF